jgi:hypothetical protein
LGRGRFCDQGIKESEAPDTAQGLLGIILFLAALALAIWYSRRQDARAIEEKKRRECLAFEEQQRRDEEQQRRNKEAADQFEADVGKPATAIFDRNVTLIEKFLAIAETKLSILDEYGDENWDALPGEIKVCLKKIVHREELSFDWKRFDPKLFSSFDKPLTQKNF